jgi:hypothetical protein
MVKSAVLPADLSALRRNTLKKLYIRAKGFSGNTLDTCQNTRLDHKSAL